MRRSHSAPAWTRQTAATTSESSEFELSIIHHAVTSGRGANCFFQSFFHTITQLPDKILDRVEKEHPASIHALVETFNSQIGLEPAADFKTIIEISRSLHPLERECVFGPILRDTYNTMIDRGLLTGRTLELDRILFQPETVQFSNAFGAEIRAYSSEQQFNLSITGGMPVDVQTRMSATRFNIGGKTFFCDYSPDQKISTKCFDLNIVYADQHLNYTLGTQVLNNEHRSRVLTTTTANGGIYATQATDPAEAPMAKEDLKFADVSEILRERFSTRKSCSL